MQEKHGGGGGWGPHILNNSVSLKKKCLSSHQVAPYAHRECSVLLPPVWVRGRDRDAGSRQYQPGSGTAAPREPGAAETSKGSFTFQGHSCPSLQPNDPKTPRGEKHFPPQASCETFLNASSSKWHFWSSQLLGASISLEESIYTCDTDTTGAQCHGKEI